jgi:hypothetical protein
MTVMFLDRLVLRPLRAAVTRRAISRHAVTGRPGRGGYHDPFFADPAVVEDDSRRMRVRDVERRPGYRA